MATKKGLYANIHAKRKRIKAGSKETIPYWLYQPATPAAALGFGMLNTVSFWSAGATF